MTLLLLLSSGLDSLSVRAQESWGDRLVGVRAARALSSPLEARRVWAARQLARFGERRHAVEALLGAVATEESRDVRAALFDAIAQRGDTSAIEVLAAFSTETLAADEGEVLRTIAAIGGEDAVRALMLFFEGDRGAANTALQEALVMLGAPAISHLIRALDNPQRTHDAAMVLARIGDARAAVALAQAYGRTRDARVQLALVHALGAIGDPRAVSMLLTALTQAESRVQVAIVDALGKLGDARVSRVLLPYAAQGDEVLALSVARALLQLEPAMAQALFLAHYRRGSEPLRAGLLREAVAFPVADLLPFFAVYAETSGMSSVLADAVARMDSTDAFQWLLGAVQASGDHHLSLALMLRRERVPFVESMRNEAFVTFGHSAQYPEWFLRSVAGDLDVAGEVFEHLGSPEVSERLWAAHAMRLLRSLPSQAALCSLLYEEDEPRVFRALIYAMITSDVRCDSRRLGVRWRMPDTAPERLWLSAGDARVARGERRRRLLREFREALRSHEPRTRAWAAMALAYARDGGAWRALVWALADEHDLVRLAVARSLLTLGVADARPHLLRQLRSERNLQVRQVLRRASEGAPMRATPLTVSGDAILRFRVVAVGEPANGRSEVQMALPDGRWLRATTFPDGQVLWADMPAGEVDVQLFSHERVME